MGDPAELVAQLEAAEDAFSHAHGRTTVTTAQQAETMRSVAEHVHDHVVTFDHDIERFCRCPGGQ
jgi:hypothetical protein